MSGFGFTIAGAIEAIQNGAFDRTKWGTIGWWLGMTNFLGGITFLVGGIAINFEDKYVIIAPAIFAEQRILWN